MDVDEQWLVIESERIRLADLLDGLAPDQWEIGSLCAGWRVRDVAAHLSLVSNTPGIGTFVAAAIRGRGNLHRMNHDFSVRHANRPVEVIAADIRTHAASRRLPVVTDRRNVLFDLLVHTQDIAIPLGIWHEMPLEAARDGATRVWTMGWPFHAQRRLSGLRLTATDVDWTVGHGSEVTGPIDAILLLLTGRPAALTRLTGEGTVSLGSRT